MDPVGRSVILCMIAVSTYGQTIPSNTASTISANSTQNTTIANTTSTYSQCQYNKLTNSCGNNDTDCSRFQVNGTRCIDTCLHGSLLDKVTGRCIPITTTELPGSQTCRHGQAIWKGECTDYCGPGFDFFERYTSEDHNEFCTDKMSLMAIVILAAGVVVLALVAIIIIIIVCVKKRRVGKKKKQESMLPTKSEIDGLDGRKPGTEPGLPELSREGRSTINNVYRPIMTPESEQVEPEYVDGNGISEQEDYMVMDEFSHTSQHQHQPQPERATPPPSPSPYENWQDNSYENHNALRLKVAIQHMTQGAYDEVTEQNRVPLTRTPSPERQYADRVRPVSEDLYYGPDLSDQIYANSSFRTS